MPFPVGLAIGLGGSLVSGLFGGAQQSAANAAAEKQAQLQHEANLANWNFNKTTARRQYRYDKQSVKIQRRNVEQNLAYQEATANQSWRHQMQIQAFDYANSMRAFNKSSQTAQQQLGFNNLAYDYALQDTARWEQEQSVMLDFEEKSTMMEYRFAQRGEALNMQQAEAVMQQTRGMGQLQQQKTYIEGLKQAGQAQAKGAMGISGEKAAQAAIAETGAATAAIIQDVINGEQNYALTSEAINMKLEQLNDNFYMDKAQLAASRVSMANQSKAMRTQAAMSKYQADLTAIANVMLEPMVPPAIPKPMDLPRPTLQDPMEFDKKLWNSVRPKKGYTGGMSPAAAGLGQFASGAFNAALSSWNPATKSFG
jgi:hypothetical protein